MDEIALRFFNWLFIDVFIRFVCFNIGWLLFKVITLGQYTTKETDEKIVIYVGLVVLIYSLIAFTLFTYVDLQL